MLSFENQFFFSTAKSERPLHITRQKMVLMVINKSMILFYTEMSFPCNHAVTEKPEGDPVIQITFMCPWKLMSCAARHTFIRFWTQRHCSPHCFLVLTLHTYCKMASFTHFLPSPQIAQKNHRTFFNLFVPLSTGNSIRVKYPNTIINCNLQIC